MKRIFLFLIISGLMIASTLAQETNAEGKIKEAKEEKEKSEQSPRDSVPSLSNPDRYRLQPNDVLEVLYRFSPEFNDIVTVQPDGFVSLPLVGDIKIGGSTLEQIKKVIIEKSSVRLRNPEITLKLREFEKPFFIVSGHIKNPGRYDFRGKTLLSEALAIAGGFTESSTTTQVFLFRKLNAEWSEVIEVNMKDSVIKEKQLKEDITLRPGDMLFIPQNKISKFERVIKDTAPFNPMNLLNIWTRRSF